jgi:hypothetical protein
MNRSGFVTIPTFGLRADFRARPAVLRPQVVLHVALETAMIDGVPRELRKPARTLRHRPRIEGR